MSGYTAQSTQHSDRSEQASTATVFAVAAAVIASTEAVALRRELDAAEIAAAVAWARVPFDVAQVFEHERAVWLAGQNAASSALDRSRLARRSVLAATLAAESATAEL